MFQIPKMDLILKGLSIENFKCFKKEHYIEFNKLTILTGANSSGKSSIIAAILGAMQSGEFPFKFSPNGKYTNMGDFAEISNNHNRKNEIKIGFNFYEQDNNESYEIKSSWNEDKSIGLPELKHLCISSDSFKFEISKEKSGYSLTFYYDPNKDKEIGTPRQSFFIDIWNAINSNPNLKGDESSQKKGKTFETQLKELYNEVKIEKFTFPDLENMRSYITALDSMRLNRVLDLSTKLFNDFDKNINLISSFRLHPDRTYLEKSKGELKVDKFGDGYLDQMMIWERRKSKKFKEIVSIMEELGLLFSIQSKRIEGGRFELQVSTKRRGTKTSLPDVGFGINQFLPIIVADLQLPEKSTLFIAQPEIHLHPSTQAKFADYITGQIKNKNKNYVIETHSEYFLNRIRVAIVKGEILGSDLNIYYLENKSADTIVHKIEFGKKGQIEGAPESFFDTYLIDVREIALNVD